MSWVSLLPCRLEAQPASCTQQLMTNCDNILCSEIADFNSDFWCLCTQDSPRLSLACTYLCWIFLQSLLMCIALFAYTCPRASWHCVLRKLLPDQGMCSKMAVTSQSAVPLHSALCCGHGNVATGMAMLLQAWLSLPKASRANGMQYGNNRHGHGKMITYSHSLNEAFECLRASYRGIKAGDGPKRLASRFHAFKELL